MTVSDAKAQISVYREAHDALAALAGELGSDELRAGSYCTDWNVAQVFSHLGSGAVIGLALLDALVSGSEVPKPESNQAVWAEWDVKSPEAMAADFVTRDEALVARWESLPDEVLENLHHEFFGRKLDSSGLIRMRFSEVVLHRWDIEVASDKAATLQASAVPWVYRTTASRGAYNAHPEGTSVEGRTLRIATTEPAGAFTLDLGSPVSMTSADDSAGVADVSLSGEAIIRLVYGRLDPDHLPDGSVVPPGLLDAFAPRA